MNLNTFIQSTAYRASLIQNLSQFVNDKHASVFATKIIYFTSTYFVQKDCLYSSVHYRQNCFSSRLTLQLQQFQLSFSSDTAFQTKFNVKVKYATLGFYSRALRSEEH